MTICLAALCDHGQKVVIASDRMITGDDVEFEQDIRKFHQVTEICIALSAGSALAQVDLIRGARGELHFKRNQSIREIVTQLKEEFVNARRQKAEELHLKPLGLDFQKFLTLQDRLSENLVLRLTRNIEIEGLHLELLVTGVDASGGHVYFLRDPGTSECFDALGFCAIGTGEHHAELAFVRASYSPSISLNRAVFLAYQAKRDAEMAPGVGGRYTDIGYIDDAGLHVLDSGTVNSLEEAYKTLIECQSAARLEAHSKIDSIVLPSGQGG